jgi:hypothetical protein
MARSWASVARGPAPSVEMTPEQKRINKIKTIWKEMDENHDLHPCCWHCGQSADLCPECVSQKSWMPSHTLQPVMKNGFCSGHGGWGRGGQPYALRYAKMLEIMPQTCSSCRLHKPWRVEDHVQVTGFSYEKMSFSFPLSPTNVVRINHWRFIRLGEPQPEASVRAAEAQAAYEKEMAFSGSVEEAACLKARVLAPSDATVW